MKQYAEINYLDMQQNSDNEELIQSVLNMCFCEEKLDNKNLYINIILTNPENIRKFNKEYRKMDKSTDVLSFPMFEKNEISNIKNEIPEVLGDIIISVQQVEKQAIEYGHAFKRELSYMVVHGFYHLMGYDHMEEEEKAQMRLKEENILEKLNITR